jgi:hypothetical protein
MNRIERAIIEVPVTSSPHFDECMPGGNLGAADLADAMKSSPACAD